MRVSCDASRPRARQVEPAAPVGAGGRDPAGHRHDVVARFAAADDRVEQARRARAAEVVGAAERAENRDVELRPRRLFRRGERGAERRRRSASPRCRCPCRARERLARSRRSALVASARLAPCSPVTMSRTLAVVAQRPAADLRRDQVLSGPRADPRREPVEARRRCSRPPPGRAPHRRTSAAPAPSPRGGRPPAARSAGSASSPPRCSSPCAGERRDRAAPPPPPRTRAAPRAMPRRPSPTSSARACRRTMPPAPPARPSRSSPPPVSRNGPRIASSVTTPSVPVRRHPRLGPLVARQRARGERRLRARRLPEPGHLGDRLEGLRRVPRARPLGERVDRRDRGQRAPIRGGRALDGAVDHRVGGLVRPAGGGTRAERGAVHPGHGAGRAGVGDAGSEREEDEWNQAQRGETHAGTVHGPPWSRRLIRHPLGLVRAGLRRRSAPAPLEKGARRVLPHVLIHSWSPPQ